MFPFFIKTILCGNLLGIFFLPLVLVRKKQPVSALAWSLTVIFIPFLGILLFLVFGASRVHRRLRRKLFHRSRFLRQWTLDQSHLSTVDTMPAWAEMDQYTLRMGGSPPSARNEVQLYQDGIAAFESKFAAIEAARHHVHLEYFIFQNDSTGRKLIDLLCQKVTEGVEVRLLVDAIGSYGASNLLSQLQQAGGKTSFFLPTRLFKHRFTIGLRNHRKILLCDGLTGFIGGLNIGDEYLGKVSSFGYWRDSHMLIRGPAVLALQRVFAEDWDFASGEFLSGDKYFPSPKLDGNTQVQIVWSGPDQETNAVRETFFAAMTSARQRLWISTPYFLPDNALLTALQSAAYRKVDVRIITQSYPPDHWLSYYAGRYFWEDLLASGVRIYQYRDGMMHAKVMLADSQWACLGSANLDIRSIRLNFEINAHIHTPKIIEQLEQTFEEDLDSSKEVTLRAFSQRSWKERLGENLCRLFSPLL